MEYEEQVWHKSRTVLNINTLRQQKSHPPLRDTAFDHTEAMRFTASPEEVTLIIQQIKWCKEQFRQMDRNGDGHVNVTEFRMHMRASAEVRDLHRPRLLKLAPMGRRETGSG